MKQNTMLFLLVLVFFLLGVVGCRRPVARFGKEYNQERIKRGIPIIPTDWTLDTVHTRESTWVNPVRDSRFKARIPVHWSKYLNYRTGDLISEIDTYYGKEDFTTVDGTFREHIYAEYYYQIDDYDYRKRQGWSIEFYSKDAPGGIEISMAEAEKILRGWDIEGFSPDTP